MQSTLRRNQQTVFTPWLHRSLAQLMTVRTGRLEAAAPSVAPTATASTEDYLAHSKALAKQAKMGWAAFIAPKCIDNSRKHRTMHR